jgi:1-deoxy-D-xylulose-5-phosphate synthase
MVVMSTNDESELRDMLYTAVMYWKGPIALRYPRGSGAGVPLKENFDLLPVGRGETVRSGHDIALLTVGAMVSHSVKAAELLEKMEISAEVVNMRFVKPLDGELLDQIASRFPQVMTVEDNVVTGGFGSAVAEYYASRNISVHLKIHGIPDRFVDHGTPSELQKHLALDPVGIAETAREFLARSRKDAHRETSVLIS